MMCNAQYNKFVGESCGLYLLYFVTWPRRVMSYLCVSLMFWKIHFLNAAQFTWKVI
jgi:hypothetical protein